MMYKTDNQIKNALDINAWRNLLNEKIVLFTGMMPEMNQDIMMDLVCHLPQFWHFSKAILKKLENQDDIRRDPTHWAQLKEIRKVLDMDLFNDHNSAEARAKLSSAILLAGERHPQGDRLTDADRQFVIAMLKDPNCTTRTLVMATLSYVGGRIFI